VGRQRPLRAAAVAPHDAAPDLGMERRPSDPRR
jgi:hypothetical protein